MEKATELEKDKEGLQHKLGDARVQLAKANEEITSLNQLLVLAREKVVLVFGFGCRVFGNVFRFFFFSFLSFKFAPSLSFLSFPSFPSNSLSLSLPPIPRETTTTRRCDSERRRSKGFEKQGRYSKTNSLRWQPSTAPSRRTIDCLGSLWKNRINLVVVVVLPRWSLRGMALLLVREKEEGETRKREGREKEERRKREGERRKRQGRDKEERRNEIKEEQHNNKPTNQIEVHQLSFTNKSHL